MLENHNDHTHSHNEMQRGKKAMNGMTFKHQNLKKIYIL